MTGRLGGIARHGQPKGPMETVDGVAVTAAEGVHGDYRSGFATTRPGRKRQVSLIEADSWNAACHDSGAVLQWWNGRRNLLVEGIRLPRQEGLRIAIGASLVLEVTGECYPCERMDALHPGLKAAMTPDWRCGFLARVIEDGDIATGDEIRILP